VRQTHPFKEKKKIYKKKITIDILIVCLDF